jgi:ABC-2 type transport system ATP-binding protein
MTTALEIKNLCKQYANGFRALNNIDLEVQQGDFFALLGANGAGKSTTIGIIASLVNKTSGTVKIFGKDIDKELSAAKRYLGLVPQEFNFNVFEPVIEVVTNQAGFFGIKKHIARERAEQCLKQLGLWDKRNDSARLLSGGMKRRLMIARALVNRPRLLILDEPTAGVDIEIRHSMWKFLRELNAEGTTIILTTHYLEEAEKLCRNIAIIKDGCIVENTSMPKLLKKLSVESFVLDVAEFEGDLPTLECFDFRKMDDTTVEVDMYSGGTMNRLFECLTKHNIQVLTIRDKQNRLEQLFMSLVGSK